MNLDITKALAILLSLLVGVGGWAGAYAKPFTGGDIMTLAHTASGYHGWQHQPEGQSVRGQNEASMPCTSCPGDCYSGTSCTAYTCSGCLVAIAGASAMLPEADRDTPGPVVIRSATSSYAPSLFRPPRR